MGKGKTSKIIHSNNGLLQKVPRNQHVAHIELQYIDNVTTTYKEAFDKLMKIMCSPHKIQGNFVININGLTENEVALLCLRLA